MKEIRERIIISGFGGQGAILAGHLLAVACMNRGLYVTHLTSYGAEMRGGAVRCGVIISDRPISSPVVSEADVLIALNQPSIEKCEKSLRAGGLVIYNSSLADTPPSRADLEVDPFPALEIAKEQDAVQAANIASIGRLLALKPHIAVPGDIEHALDAVVSERNRSKNPSNKRALSAGFEWSAELMN